MSVSIEALATLDAIERNGSFAAAAAELRRTPSTITYTIKKLEGELGVSLFDRSGYRAVMTDAGRQFLKDGRQLLNAARTATSNIQSTSSGTEKELRIAIDGMVPVEKLLPVLHAFYETKTPTRIHLLSEIYGGCWDALFTNRADLAIGAPGDRPPGTDFQTRPIGQIDFVFAIAPDHPLATLREPLQSEDIAKYRSIVGSDTSRVLPPRDSGLIKGQEKLSVQTLQTKIAAHCAGLGVGYLPLHFIRSHLKSGRLIEKKVAENQKPDVWFHMAWRPAPKGPTLGWFLNQLDETVLAEFFA